MQSFVKPGSRYDTIFVYFAFFERLFLYIFFETLIIRIFEYYLSRL